MIKYRDGINVLDLMGRCGYTSYQLRKQKVFGEAAIQRLRNGGLPTWRELDIICELTGYQVGELIEYKKQKQQPKSE